MIKNKQSLQEFISVVNYKKCVDLEISDWKEFTKKKEEAKKIDSALSKQARDLRAQLAAQGFEVTIRTSKSKKEAKKQAHFKQILVLQSDPDPKKVSQGRALFNKLSDKDKQAYLEYRKNHAND